MASVPLATFVGVIPSSLLSLQVWIIDKLSSIPWARSEFEISVGAMLFGFGMIIAIGTVLYQSTKRRTKFLPDPSEVHSVIIK